MDFKFPEKLFLNPDIYAATRLILKGFQFRVQLKKLNKFENCIQIRL